MVHFTFSLLAAAVLALGVAASESGSYSSGSGSYSGSSRSGSGSGSESGSNSYSSSYYDDMSSKMSNDVSFRSQNLDVVILNFALTLEFLEATFYKEGLRRFSVGHFKRAGFHDAKFVRDQFIHIGQDESTHVTALSGVISSLGSKPVPPCEFDFSAVRRIEDFIAIARALELTGVSAYAGAAGLVTDKNILTAAATIATVEARHSSFLNIVNRGIPISESFDTALDGGAILAIAGAFIKKCSFDLGIPPNVPLAIKTKNIRNGSRLFFAARVKG